jgi:hypothetical protein
MVCKVTTLKHKARNDTMEGASLVAKTLFTSAKSMEVSSGLWDNIIVELKFDALK